MTAPRLLPWLAGDAPVDDKAADGLRLQPVALVPEISLYLSDDPTMLWARLEAYEGHPLPAPFWASAWSGGQALARYVLDHPELVAGRRVLDIASGSGLVAIAAARAGAADVLANDIDPYALAVIDANSEANDVRVTGLSRDLLTAPDSEAGAGAEVILAGDALYEETLAGHMLDYLVRRARTGTLVLVGDPGRGHVGTDHLEPVFRYDEPELGPVEDHRERRPAVLRVRG